MIVSAPVYAAVEGALYEYDVDATDADDDPLEYVLADGPEDMTIDPDTGLIQWWPGETAAQGNPYPVHVVVSDPAGHSASQVYAIYVRATNQAPQITSAPVTMATEGEFYVYVVQGHGH